MKTYDIKNLRAELKRIFTGYRTMTQSIRKQLKKLGLMVMEGSKHYKLVTLCNQYICTISKTSSDFRSGYKIVHWICYGLSNNINKEVIA